MFCAKQNWTKALGNSLVAAGMSRKKKADTQPTRSYGYEGLAPRREGRIPTVNQVYERKERGVVPGGERVKDLGGKGKIRTNRNLGRKRKEDGI